MKITVKIAEPTGITVAIFDNGGVLSVTEYGNIKREDIRAALLAGGYTAEEITME
jgi:hypothetical protein